MAVPALLLVVWLATNASPPPRPTPPGAFAFAVLGDAPYYPWENPKYWRVLREIDAHDLAWVLHVGDIFWRPCSDERYRRTFNEFSRLRHPVIYTPGDNEWADCWEDEAAGHVPLERLGRIRQTFFAHPDRTLGRRALPLTTQAGSADYREFVENARWMHDGVVMATVHLVGSRNALEPFPQRTDADDAASQRRTAAAAAWVREAFAVARAAGARAVVVGFHANANLERPTTSRWRQSFEPFVTALEEEADAFAGPVLVIQGDDHEFIVDQPLVRRTTGRRLDNLTRLQVPGSPDVGWVRVVVAPGAPARFSFEANVVPRWKLW